MEISAIPPNANSTAQAPYVSPQEAAQRRQLHSAIKAVNSSDALGERNELVFVLNPGSHQAIVRLVDRQTGEVLLQLPPEYVVRLAEDLTKKP